MACNSLVIQPCTSKGVITAVRCGAPPDKFVGAGWKYKERLRLCPGVRIREGAQFSAPGATHSCLQKHTFRRILKTEVLEECMQLEWISSICESSGATWRLSRHTRCRHASHEPLATQLCCCPSENSHLVLAGACVPKDRQGKVVNVCAFAPTASHHL